MRALFSLITVLLTTAFFVVGIVYLIARTFGQIAWNPESKAFKRLLDNLRGRLRAIKPELVPWDQEMPGLLSLNRINERKSGWFTPFSSGQITTIYQEPVVVYVIQQTRKVRVTVTRTSEREFVFRTKDKETEIWLNGTPLGLYAGGALLAPGKSANLLARLEHKSDELHSSLILRNAKAVVLSNAQYAPGPNPRAMTLMQELDRDSENIVLAVGLLRLLALV